MKTSRVRIDEYRQELEDETFVDPSDGSTDTLHDRPPLVLYATLVRCATAALDQVVVALVELVVARAHPRRGDGSEPFGVAQDRGELGVERHR